MNLQAKKIEIMKLILETDNPSVLESIKLLFNRSKSVDFWDSLTQDQKDDIIQGINEIEEGKVVYYQDFIKKYK